MPRGKIELCNKVESLSILDPDGNVDAALDPKLEPHELRKLLRGLLVARRYDERMLKLQRQGRIGTYGPALGQEAASLGPAYVLAKTDWFVPSFREPAAMIYRGWPIEKLILWWGGNEYGATVPKDLRDLPICVPVSSQCLYAAGVAWGCKLRKDGSAVICFLGDGGTSEGDFHEAMNVAGTFKLPLVFVIQNNQWAISLPRAKQCASATLAQKCLGYGFDGIQADGNDILAMIVAAGEGLARAKSGGGPTLIEAITYRLGVHTTADDPKKYRKDEEVEEWKARDPLSRFYKYLKKRQIMDDKARDLLEEEISREITEAIEKAEKFEPNVTEPFQHCFATLPNHLEAQLAEFQAYLEVGSNGDGNSTGQDSQVYRSVH
ncbi:MAG TPA: pyruvate dehydrogenase (acetyl-transferring) E1 component subunit alpha [Phycisphaerae bacterium]|nr:pyruvate dehydrogenase (acetyl-transferring) E1 component subunit alpha [Phycisphaerae bacterium]